MRKIEQRFQSMELVREYRSIADAARICVCDSEKIRQCCVGKKKTYHGYIWKYADQ